MTGNSLHYKKHIGLHILQYYQVHYEDTTCNTNQPHIKGTICMGPIGSIQGGFKFMSLRSMKNIRRGSWDMIPMPDTVIGRVNILGRYQKYLLAFTDRKGQLIRDGDV